MRFVLIVVLVLIAGAEAAQALFVRVPADRVTEVPVARLLANIERNRNNLTPAQKARAIGRLHLIAYLRQTETLMAYRDRPAEFAEGRIDRCVTLDAQAIGVDNGREFPPAKSAELCEERRYRSDPAKELPDMRRRPPPNAHLTAAIRAYETARRLEPDNLRTRLALAFAYDCAGRREDARIELRFMMRRGLELMPVPFSATNNGRERTYPVALPPGRIDWETHAVLFEAVAQFWDIAVLDDDKRLIAALKRKLDGNMPLRLVTPIFIPLVADEEVTRFVDRTSDVAFDFFGQGERMQLGWLTDKAAWLVWDPRRAGRIDTGFQMFGSVTWIAFWENGYLPLGSLDDNGDGKITGTELRGLALWRDADGDGVSDPGEVKPLAKHKIVALGYAYERLDGDMWVARRGVEFADGAVWPTYDWLLSEPKVRAVRN